MSSSKLKHIVDDSEDSLIAKELFSKKKVEYVQYHASKLKQRYWKFPFTKAPTIFVPEGVFKGLENVKNYFDMEVRDYESESVNW